MGFDDYVSKYSHSIESNEVEGKLAEERWKLTVK